MQTTYTGVEDTWTLKVVFEYVLDKINGEKNCRLFDDDWAFDSILLIFSCLLYLVITLNGK